MPRVQWLLEHGANPNYSDGNATALQIAVTRFQPDLMQLLFDHDASPKGAMTSSSNPDNMALEFLAGHQGGDSAENGLRCFTILFTHVPHADRHALLATAFGEK